MSSSKTDGLSAPKGVPSICPTCSHEAMPGKVNCAECAEKLRVARAKIRQDRFLAGNCTRCGGPNNDRLRDVGGQFLNCESCRAKGRMNQAIHHAKRKGLHIETEKANASHIQDLETNDGRDSPEVGDSMSRKTSMPRARLDKLKHLRRERREAGLCTFCGAETSNGTRRCRECLDKVVKREMRKVLGLANGNVPEIYQPDSPKADAEDACNEDTGLGAQEKPSEDHLRTAEAPRPHPEDKSEEDAMMTDAVPGNECQPEQVDHDMQVDSDRFSELEPQPDDLPPAESSEMDMIQLRNTFWDVV